MSNQPLQGIIVCAVSRPEQAADDKVSMEQQEKDGRAFFEREDIRLLDVLRIDGYSRSFYTLREFVEHAVRKGNLDAARLEHYLHEGGFDVMWVRSTNRIAREQSINAEVIGRAIKECKALIYSQIDGWINKANRRGVAAITGFRDSSELDEFRKKRADGIAGRLRDGVPVTGKVPFSHRLVRTGKRKKDIKLVPRRNLVPLWRDVVALMKEGVAYASLERELFERHGRGEAVDKPFSIYKFRTLFFSPSFWGNNVVRWQEHVPESVKGQWAFDPSVPPPPGVDIIYGTHEAALTGELAEELKAVIIQRGSRHNANDRIHGAKPLTALIVCNRCGGFYVYNVSRKKAPHLIYLHCSRKGKQMVSGGCDNSKMLREPEIIQWLDERLHEWAEDNAPLFQQPVTEDTDGARKQLRREHQALSKRLASLTEELLEADADLKNHFRQQLRLTKADLLQAERDIAALDANALRRESVASNQLVIIETIKSIGLPAFWAQDPLEINRQLMTLLGDNRLVADNGQLIGYADKPQRPRQRGAKRTTQ